ncbi:MAG TPA: type I DNA topoisomerase [Candidatus Acidoferrales bacterium]|nr:type I DNA topoisomerase [Candidatus Acidoferrales bacterium]
MARSLVIVESPAKAKTINKYLGRDYSVKASLGHVKDLPKKVLGILLPGESANGKSKRKGKGREKTKAEEKDKNRVKQNGKARESETLFEPTYEIIPGKHKVIAELRKAGKEAENIYLAGDPDREGEAICAHLAEVLGTNRKERSKIYRVMFNEITQKAIRAAFEKPGHIDHNLVDAQQARRVLDRLVGYKISPLLWDKVRRGLSAGRVQTVALRLIVEREREIRAFVPQEYWTIHALLDAGAPPFFEAKLAKYKGEDVEIKSKEEADKIVAAVEGSRWQVAAVTQKEKRRNAPPPFTTSKLQQAAYNRLHYTAKRTMMLAQRLYEGVELGDEGSVGLITYMRTDSVRVSNDALDQVRGLIGSRFGANYLPEKPNFFKSKKDAQEAHEAIRPSDAARTPEEVRKYLEPDMFKLYQLIWQRFVASQMLPAIFDQTTIDVAAGDYTFRATGSILKFNGYLAVYDVQSEVVDSAGREDEEKEKDEDAEAEGRTLPRVTEGQTLRLERIRPEQHFTEPPPRYTEATLVKELEEKGIGRPSTYATIISTIVDREYVSKDQGRFTPTMLGEKVSELLVKSFEDIFDVGFTARLEEELDEIEEGKLPWRRSVKDFWDRFEEDLDKAEGEMQSYKAGIPTGQKCEKCGQGELLERISRHGFFLGCSRYPECDYTKDLSPELGGEEVESENTIEYCDNCGKEMTIKRGRFGPFLACTGYPECKTTRRLVHGTRKARQPDQLLDEKCPDCGSQLVKKHGRYGEFIGCTGYPKCKYIRSKTLGIACPKCGTGEFVERMTRKGRRRVFYGCNRYPECDFTTPHKPVAEPCPKCGAPFIVEKRGKMGAVRACLKEGCGWQAELPEAAPAPPVEDTVSAKP